MKVPPSKTPPGHKYVYSRPKGLTRRTVKGAAGGMLGVDYEDDRRPDEATRPARESGEKAESAQARVDRDGRGKGQGYAPGTSDDGANVHGDHGRVVGEDGEEFDEVVKRIKKRRRGGRDRMLVDKDAPELLRKRKPRFPDDEDDAPEGEHEDDFIELFADDAVGAPGVQRESRKHLFDEQRGPEPGDLSLTDPAAIAKALGTPAAYAKHVMILGEAFRRSTGATRKEAIAYLSAMFVSTPDRGFGHVALKEFGPSSGIIDIYPLEVVTHVLERFPGFLPKVGFGTLFVNTGKRDEPIRTDTATVVFLEYPEHLKIRGFALEGGGRPGYVFEPSEEEGVYRLHIRTPGRYSLLISAVNKAGFTVIDRVELAVKPADDLPVPDERPEPYPPRDASKVASWPHPTPPELDIDELLRGHTQHSEAARAGMLSAADIIHRRTRGAIAGARQNYDRDHEDHEDYDEPQPPERAAIRPMHIELTPPAERTVAIEALEAESDQDIASSIADARLDVDNELVDTREGSTARDRSKTRISHPSGNEPALPRTREGTIISDPAAHAFQPFDDAREVADDAPEEIPEIVDTRLPSAIKKSPYANEGTVVLEPGQPPPRNLTPTRPPEPEPPPPTDELPELLADDLTLPKPTEMSLTPSASTVAAEAVDKAIENVPVAVEKTEARSSSSVLRRAPARRPSVRRPSSRAPSRAAEHVPSLSPQESDVLRDAVAAFAAAYPGAEDLQASIEMHHDDIPGLSPTAEKTEISAVIPVARSKTPAIQTVDPPQALRERGASIVADSDPLVRPPSLLREEASELAKKPGFADHPDDEPTIGMSRDQVLDTDDLPVVRARRGEPALDVEDAEIVDAESINAPLPVLPQDVTRKTMALGEEDADETDDPGAGFVDVAPNDVTQPIRVHRDENMPEPTIVHDEKTNAE